MISTVITPNKGQLVVDKIESNKGLFDIPLFVGTQPYVIKVSKNLKF